MEIRVRALRELLAAENTPAILITNPVNVTYLSGFTGTLGYLLVTDKHSYLLTDFRYLDQAQAQANHCEVVDVGPSAWKKAGTLLREERIGQVLVEADHLTVDTLKKMQDALDCVQAKAVASPVGSLRQIKSDEEIGLIQAAVKLTDMAYVHVLDVIRPGAVERDIALELEYFMRKRGATGVSFDFIVASGYRSAMPHGVAGEKKLEAGDAVVLDFGCVLHGYCSDMTRTVFLGDVSMRQQDIYGRVLAAQQAALQSLKAGMTGKEADALARDVLAEANLAEFFGHGLGHGLGQVVHESPRLSPVSDEVLEPGMVVTVEPGIYLSGEFGIRIEDVVVVEQNGVCNLTGSKKELLCL